MTCSVRRPRLTCILPLLALAALNTACEPATESERLPGARGVVEANEQLGEFRCGCESSEPAERQECIADWEQYLPTPSQWDCIDRVLAEEPEARRFTDCEAQATYDLVECLDHAGCPPEGVVSTPSGEGRDSESAPEEETHPAAACDDAYDAAVDACGDFDDAVADRLETECDLGRQDCITSNGDDCSVLEPEPADGSSTPGCNPDVESCAD